LSIKNCSVGIVGIDQEFVILEDDKLTTYVSNHMALGTYIIFLCTITLWNY